MLAAAGLFLRYIMLSILLTCKKKLQNLKKETENDQIRRNFVSELGVNEGISVRCFNRISIYQ